ncbi:MAG: hypothetical protein IT497_01445, partial [Ottowia sp.]|nr:hypothetical protein [Ottowia sp.]
AALIRRIANEKVFDKGMFLHPAKMTRWGVNIYSLNLGKIVAYLKVDEQPFPPELDCLALSKNQTITILSQKFEESDDFKPLMKTSKQSDINATKKATR